MEYYYVTFQCFHGVPGQTIIVQQDAGFHGFNLAGVSRYITEKLNEPVAILNWQRITEQRYEEFKKYLELQAIDPNHQEGDKKGVVLQLHPGGKDEPKP